MGLKKRAALAFAPTQLNRPDAGKRFQLSLDGRRVHAPIMFPQDQACPAPMEGHDSFHTTHWSIVFSAQDTQDPQAAGALEQLCRAYWRPLYTYIRRLGNDPETAQDLTQAFFERLLENKGLKTADPDKGRFRSLLLASLKNFLVNEWDRRTAVKRGGRYHFISLQVAGAEVEFQLDARRELPPDRVYERRWALAVLEQARQRLEADYRARGKHAVFIGLSAHLAGDSEAPAYTAAAASLGLSAEAARKAVERMRRRYGQLLREVVAQTVATTEDIDEELRHLRTLLQG